MRLGTVVVTLMCAVLMTGCTLVYTLSVPRPQSRHDVTGSLVIDGIMGRDFDRYCNGLGAYHDIDERTPVQLTGRMHTIIGRRDLEAHTTLGNGKMETLPDGTKRYRFEYRFARVQATNSYHLQVGQRPAKSVMPTLKYGYHVGQRVVDGRIETVSY